MIKLSKKEAADEISSIIAEAPSKIFTNTDKSPKKWRFAYFLPKIFRPQTAKRSNVQKVGIQDEESVHECEISAKFKFPEIANKFNKNYKVAASGDEGLIRKCVTFGENDVEISENFEPLKKSKLSRLFSWLQRSPKHDLRSLRTFDDSTLNRENVTECADLKTQSMSGIEEEVDVHKLISTITAALKNCEDFSASNFEHTNDIQQESVEPTNDESKLNKNEDISTVTAFCMEVIGDTQRNESEPPENINVNMPEVLESIGDAKNLNITSNILNNPYEGGPNLIPKKSDSDDEIHVKIIQIVANVHEDASEKIKENDEKQVLE